MSKNQPQQKTANEVVYESFNREFETVTNANEFIFRFALASAQATYEYKNISTLYENQDLEGFLSERLESAYENKIKNNAQISKEEKETIEALKEGMKADMKGFAEKINREVKDQKTITSVEGLFTELYSKNKLTTSLKDVTNEMNNESFNKKFEAVTNANEFILNFVLASADAKDEHKNISTLYKNQDLDKLLSERLESAYENKIKNNDQISDYEKETIEALKEGMKADMKGFVEFLGPKPMSNSVNIIQYNYRDSKFLEGLTEMKLHKTKQTLEESVAPNKILAQFLESALDVADNKNTTMPALTDRMTGNKKTNEIIGIINEHKDKFIESLQNPSVDKKQKDKLRDSIKSLRKDTNWKKAADAVRDHAPKFAQGLAEYFDKKDEKSKTKKVDKSVKKITESIRKNLNEKGHISSNQSNSSLPNKQQGKGQSQGFERK